MRRRERRQAPTSQSGAAAGDFGNETEQCVRRVAFTDEMVEAGRPGDDFVARLGEYAGQSDQDRTLGERLAEHFPDDTESGPAGHDDVQDADVRLVALDGLDDDVR